MLPTINYVGVARYVGDNISVGISESMNRISKYVSSTNSGYVVSNPGDLKYYGIEGLIKNSCVLINCKQFICNNVSSSV